MANSEVHLRDVAAARNYSVNIARRERGRRERTRVRKRIEHMAIITTYPAPQLGHEAFGAGPSGQRAVYQRLKESYSPTYLTILSVVQAVAMGDLAQVVAASYQDFTLVQWALTFNTFGVLIITWNVFSVQSALWGWIPDVRDSAVPFIVGALELFLNHTITVSLSAWLIAISLIAIAGAFGTLHISWRARGEAEHRELLRWLTVHMRLYIAYLIAGGGVLLALAWVCSDDHLNAIITSDDLAGKLGLGVALFSTLALVGSVSLFHLLWRQAIIYAQADNVGGQEKSTKGTHGRASVARATPKLRRAPSQPRALLQETTENRRIPCITWNIQRPCARRSSSWVSSH
jgi:hypothetical protein